MEKQTLKNADQSQFESQNFQSNDQVSHNPTNFLQPSVQSKLKDRFSPFRFLMVLIAGIFLAEVLAMIIVHGLEPISYYYLTLFDALIMVVAIFPIVYFLTLRPLIKHIEWRRQAEKTLFGSLELQERFFDSIDTFIAYMDRDFNFIRVNEAYAMADGHQPEYS